jgi:hypothetical protein
MHTFVTISTGDRRAGAAPRTPIAASAARQVALLRWYRVVPTEPVDAAWHASLQHTEPYTTACQQIAGHFVYHVPILTEGMADGSSLEYTRQAQKATGYYIDPEFWDGEANSCCPPNPGI